MRVSLPLILHLGAAIYFASIKVSGELQHAGGTALSPLRTKAFCLACLVLMQVELEGLNLCVLQLWDISLLGLRRPLIKLFLNVSYTKN